ncbi:two-component response regulator (plasmid) [Scytonema sp. HK-05]|uniref:response regulator n=1 Tax=Scytonema sp. HK-05 TaxID=1137095 RepID=UPI000935FB79|nr:response regulator [Scytonema sp. HK-05]OKH53634.1 hypothetical protein NIES2130_30275 [Scytonema sp. HK-05]BAY50055.1 two-component response regulator [Scytonema sp. HK-05]
MVALEVLKGLRVLAVDDDADTLDLIKVIFDEYNAQVTLVASVSEALQGITRLKPHLLISDIAMPKEDGYSLIRKVRNLTEEVRQIPAIALTALATEEALTLALNAGFSTYVAKPFDPDELVAVASKLAWIAVLDRHLAWGNEKLSFIRYESNNKIWFQYRCCNWNKFYKLNEAKEAGFINR